MTRYNGTLESARKDGKLAFTDNIFDKRLSKMQSDINREVETKIESLEENISTGGGNCNCTDKLSKADIVQVAGDATDKVMSQKAVTDQIKELVSIFKVQGFSLTMYSSNGWNFSSSMVTKTDSEGNYLPFTTLSVKAFYYNTEVTDKIYKVKWTRETSYTHDDEVWNLKHEGVTNNIPITYDDLGGDNYQIGNVIFRCEAQYTIDGTSHQSAMIITL